MKIADFFGVDAKWLVTGEKPESSTSPKDPGVSDAARLACEKALMDHQSEYRFANALTLEERVTKLEAALRAIEQILKQI